MYRPTFKLVRSYRSFIFSNFAVSRLFCSKHQMLLSNNDTLLNSDHIHWKKWIESEQLKMKQKKGVIENADEIDISENIEIDKSVPENSKSSVISNLPKSDINHIQFTVSSKTDATTDFKLMDFKKINVKSHLDIDIDQASIPKSELKQELNEEISYENFSGLNKTNIQPTDLKFKNSKVDNVSLQPEKDEAVLISIHKESNEVTDSEEIWKNAIDVVKKSESTNVLEPPVNQESIDNIAPVLRDTYNPAAYVNR